MRNLMHDLKRIYKEDRLREKQTDRTLKITPNMIFKTTMVAKRKERKQYEQQSKQRH